jgi:hypothetical protein
MSEELEKLVTMDTILDFLQKCVKSKVPVSPSLWVDAALKMQVLLGDEQDKFINLKHEVAVFKEKCMAEGATAAHAKVQAESLDIYKNMMKQEARIGRIEEMGRIAKLQARLKDSEYRSN